MNGGENQLGRGCGFVSRGGSILVSANVQLDKTNLAVALTKTDEFHLANGGGTGHPFAPPADETAPRCEKLALLGFEGQDGPGDSVAVAPMAVNATLALQYIARKRLATYLSGTLTQLT